jgi:mono/diheme cytochrome c family protein
MFTCRHQPGARAKRLQTRPISAFFIAGAVFFACARSESFSPNVHAQQPRTVADGVFTDPQAQRGQAIFKDRCSPCHGAKLEGVVAPPLTGPDFVADFSQRPLADLVAKIKNTMPANDPGHLMPQQAVDLVAYILQVGRFPAGPADLSMDDGALRQITWPAGPVPAKPIRSATAEPVAFPPIANLAQLMKGIMFPSSNIIFNVQTRDPGAPKDLYETGKGGFSWVDWGAGIYPPWELVDDAALALAEAAPRILTPDRRCENGKRAPVERADWIKFTQELVEAARAAYKASQSRSQDAVSDATERLSDACFSCHIVYRDHVGGTPEDPSNKAARCVVQ